MNGCEKYPLNLRMKTNMDFEGAELFYRKEQQMKR